MAIISTIPIRAPEKATSRDSVPRKTPDVSCSTRCRRQRKNLSPKTTFWGGQEPHPAVPESPRFPVSNRRQNQGRLLCRPRIQRRINQASKQRTTAQIATAPRMFPWIAVIRAEMPNAVAIRIPEAAPTRVPNPRSCLTLTRITADASNCPATHHQPAPIPAILPLAIDTPQLRQ